MRGEESNRGMDGEWDRRKGGERGGEVKRRTDGEERCRVVEEKRRRGEEKKRRGEEKRRRGKRRRVEHHHHHHHHRYHRLS